MMFTIHNPKDNDEYYTLRFLADNVIYIHDEYNHHAGQAMSWQDVYNLVDKFFKNKQKRKKDKQNVD